MIPQRSLNSLSFSLLPFPGKEPQDPHLAILARVCRSRDIISLRYELSGRLEGIVIPEQAEIPMRRDGLWQETCFELFVGFRYREAYWEFNFSPAGHWNVYRFSGYREGMQWERAIASPSCAVSRGRSLLVLELEIDASAIALGEEALDMGMTAVLRHNEGGLSYWALAHCAPQPDFHCRESFLAGL